MSTVLNRPSKKQRTLLYQRNKKMKERRKATKKNHRVGFRSVEATENEVQMEYELNSYELGNFLDSFKWSALEVKTTEVVEDGEVVLVFVVVF